MQNSAKLTELVTFDSLLRSWGWHNILILQLYKHSYCFVGSTWTIFNNNIFSSLCKPWIAFMCTDWNNDNAEKAFLESLFLKAVRQSLSFPQRLPGGRIMVSTEAAKGVSPSLECLLQRFPRSGTSPEGLFHTILVADCCVGPFRLVK